MCLHTDFVWERVFNMVFLGFSLFFRTSILEKSDESYVFFRSDCWDRFVDRTVGDCSSDFWMRFDRFLIQCRLDMVPG